MDLQVAVENLLQDYKINRYSLLRGNFYGFTGDMVSGYK